MYLSPAQAMPMRAHERRSGAIARTLLIGLIAFLTVIDLFGTQAILPALAQAYGVPRSHGLRRQRHNHGHGGRGARGGLLQPSYRPAAWHPGQPDPSGAPDGAPGRYAEPRRLHGAAIAQGLCMAAAFTLTLAYLCEHCGMSDAAGAFAAYITGNAASNLFGRLLAAGLADHLGLQTTFLALAMLNLAGAALVWFGLTHATPMMAHGSGSRSPLSIWSEHLKNPSLRPSFAIGFWILFAFIGTFTYVNFVLVREPLAVGPMALGFVYLVFAPSLVTTLLAGRAVQALGVRPALWGGLGVAAAGLPLLLAPSLPALLAGLTLIGIGTFFAQATATGFVNRAANRSRFGERDLSRLVLLRRPRRERCARPVLRPLGLGGVLAGVGAALAAAALLAVRLKAPAARRSSALSNRQADGISVRSFDSA